MKVMVFESADKMAEYMVGRWTELSGCSIQSRGYFAAALSGGRTPVLFYRKLAARGAQLPWGKTHLFFADERFVTKSDVDSNYRLLSESLLKEIQIPERNVHAVTTDGLDLQSSAKQYEEEIKRFFMLPHEGLPEFDLIMLGIGEDGHTASLFPGDAALLETSRLACPVRQGSDRHDRITLTLPVINNAGLVIFLVSGKAKASVLRAVAERRERNLPASLVDPRKGSLLFLADKDAAQGLTKLEVSRL